MGRNPVFLYEGGNQNMTAPIQIIDHDVYVFDPEDFLDDGRTPGRALFFTAMAILSSDGDNDNDDAD